LAAVLARVQELLPLAGSLLSFSVVIALGCKGIVSARRSTDKVAFLSRPLTQLACMPAAGSRRDGGWGLNWL
jgi:hypothetical protein